MSYSFRSLSKLWINCYVF